MRDKIAEYEAVEAAAMKFVKSVAEGNSTYARELFTDEAVLFGFLDGKLEHGSIEQFYHNVDTVSGGADFKARVDVLFVEETLAAVRVLVYLYVPGAECGGDAKRMFSDPAAVIYKGSGYYCTDNPHGGSCNCSQCKGGN